jgi:23S rRNA (guanosine2251-2'-O)-methyltransferase
MNNSLPVRKDDALIFGIRAVIEAAMAGKEFERIFIQRDVSGNLVKELKTILAEKELHYVSVPAEKINRMTRKNHQGVVAILSQVSYSDIGSVIPTLFESGVDPVVIMLDRITDVRNFGAICRTAEFMGVGAVIIPERGSALISGDAVKASAGALNRITVCREHNLKDTIAYLKESGFQIVGCTEKGDLNANQCKFDRPVCIIMGSEEDGISPEYLKRCDHKVRIQGTGNIASLNVSVAAGMILYEIYRQKIFTVN